MATLADRRMRGTAALVSIWAARRRSQLPMARGRLHGPGPASPLGEGGMSSSSSARQAGSASRSDSQSLSASTQNQCGPLKGTCSESASGAQPR